MADKEITMSQLGAGGGSAAPGQLTGSELIDMVMGMLGRTATAERATVLIHLNWAQQEIARQNLWKCLNVVSTGSLTTDTSQYSWPSGLRIIHSFKITGDTPGKLTEWPKRRADLYYPDPSTSEVTGLPTVYIQYGTYFDLLPIPDEDYDYKLFYHKWPADLADGSSASDFLVMDDLIVYMAAMHYAMRLGLLSDHDQFRRIVYQEYPLGSHNRTGLLKQAKMADWARPDYVVQKREFRLHPTNRPPDYLSNPRIMS